MSRFMDVTTDFGFKKLFGDEANLELTMSLSNPEQLPETSDQRVGIYDCLCHDAKSSQCLVEMQKNRTAFVQDRMVYYSTFPIAAPAKKGGRRYYPVPKTEVMVIRDPASVAYGEKETMFGAPAPSWNYELKTIYCIAILGYVLKGSTTAVNRNSIGNDQPPHEPFCDKLKFVTVELPSFDPSKPEYSLDRHLNKWLYFLKHSSDLERIPDVFKAEGRFKGRAEGKIAGKIKGKIEGKIDGNQ